MVKVQKITAPVVRLTPRAIEQFKKAMLREQASKESGLRIFLVESGKGFRYDMIFEAKVSPSDHVFSQKGVRVIIDENDVPYLQGHILDFVDFDEGGAFLFVPPSEE